MQNNLSTILITGATGFVGMHLCRHLLQAGFRVKAVGRKPILGISHQALDYIRVDKFDENSDWENILRGVDVVVHLASRAHMLRESGMKHLTQYQEVNVKSTQALAHASIKYNVQRFIYISTIKVNGEKTINMALRAEDQPRPQDAYGLSKLQAEQILQEESRRSGLEWVIIRPPLVYGPGVKGNFRKLLSLTKKRIPLPFGAARNRRSFVSIYNLCSFIECCITHPHAMREVFLVSDNQDLSLAQLIRILRKTLNRRSGLFPFPLSILKLMGTIMGKRQAINKMVDDLQVNIEKSGRLLGWRPPFTVEESIKMLLETENNNT